MVKFVLLFPKKKGLSHDEFMHQWKDVCVPKVHELPGLRRLVISPVIEQPGVAEPRYDGIAEWWFDDAAAGKAALNSPQAKAVIEDLPHFVEMDNFILSVTEEITLIGEAISASEAA
jgi:uncharacterized protein (TIGR02118 family)